MVGSPCLADWQAVVALLLHVHAATVAHVELGLGPAPGQVHARLTARRHTCPTLWAETNN